MNGNEYRVARSTETDTTVNTIDTHPKPKFAILELLDDKDSQYFRRYIKKRGWKEVTPDVPRKKKTYHSTRPDPKEVEEYTTVSPDWFYISGHYARSEYTTPQGPVYVLPAGFFNEPFHDKEWMTTWAKSSAKTFFLQTETLTPRTRTKFQENVKKQWHRSPYKPGAKTATKDTADRKRVMDQWLAVWDNPTVDRKVESTTALAMRGLLCGSVWDEAKLVLLIGCNTLQWRKEVFHEAFPNALVLGYIDKNPANATPHIRAFLRNAFRGVSDPFDPKLSDHKHLAKAWMDVHYKNRLSNSHRMTYMMPDGQVYGAKQVGAKRETAAIGQYNQLIFRDSSSRYKYFRFWNFV